MWDRRCLEPPVECKVKVKLCNADIDTLTLAKTKLRESQYRIKAHLDLMAAEHYVIKRIIYKCINQMRRDKALASLRQVNSCIKRFDGLKMGTVRQTLEEYITIDLSLISPEEYLPSRQLLQYNLVQLMSMAALLTQTARYCSHTYLAVKQYLGLGNLVQHYLVIMASSARIWYICRSLRTHVYSWYQALFLCLEIMVPTKVQWLPDTESLPDNLSAWIQGQFGEETMPEIISDGIESGTQFPGQGIDAGENLFGMEDLGVPVQRKEMEDTMAGSMPENGPDKKKRKAKASQATSEEKSQNMTKYSEDSQDGRIQKLKKHLKLYLKTSDDLSDFMKSLNSKKIAVGDEVISLSKIGRRKILKKIDTAKLAASENGPEASVESMVLKKLRLCLGRMLVKYDQRSECNGLESKRGSSDTLKKCDSLKTKRMQKVKKYLRLQLKSREELNQFVNSLNHKTISLSDEIISLSKVGKRLVLKKIETIGLTDLEKGPGPSVEKVLLRKLSNCIGRLLVKYDRGASMSKPKSPESNVKSKKVKPSTDKDSSLLNITSEVRDGIMNEERRKLKQRKKAKKKVKGQTSSINETRKHAPQIGKAVTSSNDVVKHKRKRRRR